MGIVSFLKLELLNFCLRVKAPVSSGHRLYFKLCVLGNLPESLFIRKSTYVAHTHIQNSLNQLSQRHCWCLFSGLSFFAVCIWVYDSEDKIKSFLDAR